MTKNDDANNYVIPLKGSSPIKDVDLVGGKGANLLILARGGFNVPHGFIVTTAAYQRFVKENHLEEVIRTILAEHDLSNHEDLEEASATLRKAFESASMPRDLVELIEREYQRMGTPAVAVRSSAITEDLPDLSFAGQHDTFLNVTTIEGVIKAIIKCFSSLWTARGIRYRHEQEIVQENLAMAVIVQEMIPSEVSGVMFTANPVTGKRREVIIEATWGLGEALVSGMVESDEFVVDENDRIISRKVGKKDVLIEPIKDGDGTVKNAVPETHRDSIALSDEMVLEVARVGRSIEEQYGHPQDIEWAIARGQLYILQSRAITTLYPLPKDVNPRPLQVYMSFNAVQGIIEPFTPLGIEVFQQMLGNALVRGHLWSPSRPIETFMTSAGHRLWINVTPIIRDPLGRQVVHRRFLTIAEKDIRDIITDLLSDPDLNLVRHVPFITRTHRQALRVMATVWRRVIEALRDPRGVRRQRIAHHEALIDRLRMKSTQLSDSVEKLKYNQKILHLFFDVVLNVMPLLLAAYLPLLVIQRLVSPHLDETETDFLLELTRALPNNVTTTMDLELWTVAMKVKNDQASMNWLLTRSDDELTNAYLTKSLPKALQDAIDDFLDKFWGRGLAEIDVGRPRWQEHPQPLFNALRAYVQLDESSPHAPPKMFQRGKKAAQAAYLRLRDKLQGTRGAPFNLRMLDAAVVRLRTLAGIREYPKFVIVRLFTIIRKNFLDIGADLVTRGILERSDDVFFLTMDEIEHLLTKASPKSMATIQNKLKQRKTEYAREFFRKRVPKVLLSDGRMFFDNPRTELLVGDGKTLKGTGVSPGRHEGRVRVLLTPHGDQLLPGEILVCPATDPSWTPLFASARGLIMEVGGLMTHGSVVARELGIPAVVGVSNATKVLKTGQTVVIDGSKGIVVVKDDKNA